MVKLLPFAALFIAVFAVLGYFALSDGSPSGIKQISLGTVTSKPEDNRIKELEQSVLELADKVNGSDSGTASQSLPDPSNTQARLNALEVSIADLQAKIKKLESGSQSQLGIQTTAKKSPAYILSLGSGDSTTKTDWTTANNIDITIDPAEFPGYTSMQLEAYLKVKDGNGKAYARLHDSATGLSELSSEVSTSSENFTWAQSPTFTINGSKKTYKFQIKSLTGYEAFIQAARVKVNF